MVLTFKLIGLFGGDTRWKWWQYCHSFFRYVNFLKVLQESHALLLEHCSWKAQKLIPNTNIYIYGTLSYLKSYEPSFFGIIFTFASSIEWWNPFLGICFQTGVIKWFAVPSEAELLHSCTLRTECPVKIYSIGISNTKYWSLTSMPANFLMLSTFKHDMLVCVVETAGS